MFGLTSKQRNATKMICYSELTSSLTSAEIKPILILVTKCYSLDRHAFLGLLVSHCEVTSDMTEVRP